MKTAKSTAKCKATIYFGLLGVVSALLLSVLISAPAFARGREVLSCPVATLNAGCAGDLCDFSYTLTDYGNIYELEIWNSHDTKTSTVYQNLACGFDFHHSQVGLMMRFHCDGYFQNEPVMLDISYRNPPDYRSILTITRRAYSNESLVDLYTVNEDRCTETWIER